MTAAGDSSVSSKLKLTLLGRFVLSEADGNPIEIQPRRGRALLGFLAIQRDNLLTREQLSTLIWGESSQERARHSLRQLLTTLRRALPSECIDLLMSHRDSVALDLSQISVDALDMEQLAAEGSVASCELAARLYKGPLLSGIEIGTPAFGQWLVQQRERYAALAIECQSKLLDSYLSAEQFEQAAAAATQILELDGLHEGAHRALMWVYYKRGQRALAVRQYQRCIDLLNRDLGVQPEEETVKLYVSISRDQPGLRLASLRGTGEPADPFMRAGQELRRQTHSAEEAPFDHTSNQPEPAAPHFGRAAEIAAISQSVKRCLRSGQGEIVLLLGEAGIGKTALAEAVVKEFKDALVVKLGQGRATERGRAMEFWVELLHDDPAVSHAAAVGPGALTEQAVFAALRRLQSSDPSGRPLLLLIENLQWIDPASLECLVYAANRLSTLPAVLIATARSEDVIQGTELETLVNWMSSLPNALTLRLGPLDHEHLRSLVDLVAKEQGKSQLDETALTKVWQIGEGNPLVVMETARTYLLQPPDDGGGAVAERIRAGIEQRLQALPSEALSALGAAAVLGRECDFELWERVAQLDTSKALDLFEQLSRQSWLEPSGRRLRFARMRFREVIHERLPSQYRKRLHELALDAIENLYASDLRHHHADLARHALAAQRPEVGARHLLLAAEVKTREGAWDAVKQLINDARELALSGDTTVRRSTEVAADLLLAKLLRAKVEVAESRSRLLRRLRGHSQQVTDSSLSASLAMNIAMLLEQSGEHAEALIEARRASRHLEESGGETPWTAADRLCSQTHMLAGHREGVLQRLQSTIDHCRAVADRHGEALALGALGLCHGIGGEFSEGLTAANNSVVTARQHGDPAVTAVSEQYLGQLLAWQGRSDAAIEVLTNAMDKAKVCGDLPRQYLLLGHLGHALLGMGQCGAAVEKLDAALTLADRLGTRFQVPFFTAIRAEALSALDRSEQALKLANEALQLSVESNQPWAQSIASRAVGTAGLRSGSVTPTGAIRAFQSALAIQETLGLKFEVARTLQLQGAALRNRGQSEVSERSERLSQRLFEQMDMQMPALPEGFGTAVNS